MPLLSPKLSCTLSLFIYFLYFMSSLFLFHFRAELLDGDKSLVIKNVVPSDEGAYICEALNSVGQISSKAQLIVNCKYSYSLFSPLIHSHGCSSMAMVEKNLNFHCKTFDGISLLLVMHRTIKKLSISHLIVF